VISAEDLASLEATLELLSDPDAMQRVRQAQLDRGFISGPLTTAPRRVGTPLLAPFDGHWRARRGEYRVRYETDDDSHTVRVLDIDHRRDAYRS